MDDTTPVGFNRRDAIRIENSVLGYEHQIIPGPSRRKPISAPLPRESCDCCPPCCGTLWYVVGDEIVWSADFFKDVSQYDLDNWFSAGGPWPYVSSCDVDSNGNVYQAGLRSARLQTDLTKPQQAMYSLRSYSSDGQLQWSWGKNPYGYVSGSVRDTDLGISRLRCGGADVFGAYGILTNDHCYLRKHSTTDGTPVLDIDATSVNTSYGSANVFVGAGPTTLVLTGYGEATTHYPIIVLDHNGNFVWGEKSNGFEPVWVDKTDVLYGICRGSATPDGDRVASYDSGGTFLNVPIIRDGFIPARLRTLDNQLVADNGSEIRLYTINGTGNYTHKTTSTERDDLARKSGKRGQLAPYKADCISARKVVS